ncbi:MAG: hypothetical protein LBD13_02460 [Spirochaetaceae bacterium]|jgi:hypothetical protein|nr:hypothetical protein [Spirochaetaceae bacterium]
MKKETVSIPALYLFFLIFGSPLFGVGEKILVIGAGTGWNAVANRNGVTEIYAIRPYPVLVLSSSAMSGADSSLDMSLSFDEADPALFKDQAGRYLLSVSEGLSAADRRLARIGMGAALFSGAMIYHPGREDPGIAGPLRLTPMDQSALFFPGRRLKDFSIEFWLFPLNMENGEHIFAWNAARQQVQRIQCAASRNRLQWTFSDFFDLDADDSRTTVSLSGVAALIPRTWSHHLVRFDSETGLLEYLVNGQSEDMVYTTRNGREGGQIYYPVVGQGGSFILGNRFMGMLDEFKIHSRFAPDPLIRKYPRQGGRIETRSLDLGEYNSRVLKIEAAGGRTSNTGGVIQNEYASNGNFRFPDDAMIQFFIRAGESPYRWDGVEWQSFTPGTELHGIHGRYIQIAAAFYPSGDGETTPYLDEISVTYLPDEPPRAPSQITAIARDGAIDISWRASPDRDAAGYLLYYGTASGEYFGEGAAIGDSPVNVGKSTSVRIGGLTNGTLYYFAVAAYDRLDPLHIGVFSREVSARPLRNRE